MDHVGLDVEPGGLDYRPILVECLLASVLEIRAGHSGVDVHWDDGREMDCLDAALLVSSAVVYSSIQELRTPSADTDSITAD